MSAAAERESVMGLLRTDPEALPVPQDTFRPITDDRYWENIDPLYELYDPADADALQQIEAAQRPGAIVDTVFARLGIAPDTAILKYARSLQQRREGLCVRAQEIADIDPAALSSDESLRQRLTVEFDENTRQRRLLKEALVPYGASLDRQHELDTAKQQAANTLATWRTDLQSKTGEFRTLVTGIHSVVMNMHPHADVISSLDALWEIMPEHHVDVAAARRIIETMLLLRTFPVDENQEPLDF